MTQIPKAPLRGNSQKSSVQRQELKELPGKQQKQTNANSNYLGQLSVGQKIALSTLPLAIALGITLGLNFNTQLQELRKDRLALTGIRYLTPTKDLLATMQENRRSSILFLTGSPIESTSFEQEQSKINTLFSQLEDLDRNSPLGNKTSQSIQNVKVNWHNIASDVQQKKVSPEVAFSRMQKLFSMDMTGLFNQIAIDSNLRSLNYATTPELVNLVTNVVPRSWPDSGTIRTRTVNAVRLLQNPNNVLPTTSRSELNIALQFAQQAQNSIEQAAKDAIDLNPSDTKVLAAALVTMHDTMNKVFLNFQYIAREGRLPASPSEVIGALQPSLVAQSQFYDKSIDALNIAVENQISSVNSRLISSVILALVTAIVAFALVRIIANAIIVPLQRLTRVARSVSQGRYAVRVPITTMDELGILGSSFNTAAAQLEDNARRVEQERKESQRLQGNISEFLDITMDISEGDLTKRGKVTEDVLGNVVDSINLMTQELGLVLRDVQSASNSVSGGSRAMLSTTEQINYGTRLTVTETERVTQQAQELIAAIRDMANKAQTSADTAQQALQASKEGQEAVVDTLAGMQNIRTTSQQVAQQIQGLSQSSEQIQEIVDSIAHIASQTNLLALHASIEAAGAGEAGQRFTIVAQEVSQLADSSSHEAQRIAVLIRNLQKEIATTLNTVSESSQEVEQGYRVAGTAGERLREIATLSERAAALAEQISLATQDQVRGIEQMGQAVAQINSIAQNSAFSVEEGRAAAEQLQQLATQLNSSLSRFRLPL